MGYNPNLSIFILVQFQLLLENFITPPALAGVEGNQGTEPQAAVAPLPGANGTQKSLDFVAKLLNYLSRCNKFPFILLDFLGVNNNTINYDN